MSGRKRRQEVHPALRYVAPSTIQTGVPLAELVGQESIALLAESMVAVAPAFNTRRFSRAALPGLDGLGLMQRAAHVARALAAELPTDFDSAAEVLIAAFGPELQATEGNGLAPFFYLPHSQMIALRGGDSLLSGLRACYELTKRFTAEFCIRPLLIQHPAKTLKQLRAWVADPNPHVRRLVSEGTRPRLPWGLRLKAFQDDPQPTLALLERLKDDPIPYVYRSVANHLGDILKDNPEVAYATCERWLEESTSLDPDRVASRLWIVRHALRLPAKRGELQAVRLRQAAKGVRSRGV